MSSTSQFGASRPGKPRSKSASTTPDWAKLNSPFAITLYVLAALAIGLMIASEVWTRYLWFDQLGFSSVLIKRWIVQGVLFVLGAAAFAIPLYVSLRIPFRQRAVYAPVTREQEALEQVRSAIEPLRKAVTVVAPIVIGLFAGLASSRSWDTVLLALNAQPFNETDPVFNRDLSFFIFTLPLIESLIGFLQFLVLLCLIVAVIAHFVYGGVAWGQERGLHISKVARRHLGVLATIYVLLLGIGHWFERYSLVNQRHARFDGASYTDANAILPAQTILAISAVIVAVLFAAWVFRADWRIPAVGVALMILSTVVVGSAYPWAIQQFKVNPNERALEQPYIQRGIDATRTAYGIDSVREVSYAAQTNAEPGALRADADTTAQIRLMDPAVVSPTFEQREANRQYWGFDDVLAVDRYKIDGDMQDTVIGVRELRPDQFRLNERSWVDQHIIFTHGYGAAAAYGNRRNVDGEPAFLVSGVPGNSALGEYEERVYFGRHSPNYSIVGAPEGAAPEEFDYQIGSDENGEGGTQVRNTYTGDGGPSVGNWFNRMLFAIKFREFNILISSYVNSESQILYDRNPQKRVREVAPFLSLDSQMYPAIVDGRMVWIIDGYTTTSRYPYSRNTDLSEALTDSQSAAQDIGTYRTNQANYMRNSVKATVDAFDGSVTLYAWDTEDPILQSWQQIFPDALQPASEISSELMSHMRYPADLFKVQREMLASYHVTDADEFFGQQDFWQTPPDPRVPAPTNPDGTTGAQPPQPPMYLTMEVPGMDSPRFTLSSSYIPADGQNVLTGFLAVDSETGNESGNPAETYGDLTLLVLPASNPVNGPGQVQASFNSEPNVSQALNLLKSGNSEVINGNLLTLPVGGGLLYVQPVYLQSSATGGGTQYPLLQMVLVSFGEKIGFAPTLDQALDEVFGGDSGAEAGDAAVPDTGGQSGSADTATGEGEVKDSDSDDAGSDEGAEPGDGDQTPAQPAPAPAPGAADGTAQERLDTALADMDKAIADGERALDNGDWAAYGESQERLQDALQRATEANEELTGSGTEGG